MNPYIIPTIVGGLVLYGLGVALVFYGLGVLHGIKIGSQL